MDLGPWEDGPGLLAVPQKQGEILGVGSHGHWRSQPFGHQFPGRLSMEGTCHPGSADWTANCWEPFHFLGCTQVSSCALAAVGLAPTVKLI